jgi:copper homeostasis protein
VSIPVEICVDSVAGARVAEDAGADRIELCAGLAEGGTTPSIGTIREALRAVNRVGVQVLIRPRGGDFVYDADEVDVMLADIAAIRALTPRGGTRVGFVLGALTPAGDIDVPTTRWLLDACDGAPVTFHKAFDLTRDLPAALDVLTQLRVHRVLTSGGHARAVDATGTLRALVARSAGRIAVMAGGGVRAGNVAALVAATGVPEVHLRAAHSVSSPMQFHRDGISISPPQPPNDLIRSITCGEAIHAVRRALGSDQAA